MSLPRCARNWRSERSSKFTPRYETSPVTVVPGGVRPMMARHTVLLPEPDSPTSPSVWPWRIVTLTLFTAGEPGAVFGKTTVKSLIRNSSSGKSCKVGVGCMVLLLLHDHGAEIVAGEG